MQLSISRSTFSHSRTTFYHRTKVRLVDSISLVSLSARQTRITPIIHLETRDIQFREHGKTVSLQVPGRLLLMEGWLNYQDPSTPDSRPYYFFLFSDIFLCCCRGKTISRALYKLSKSKEIFNIIWQEEIHSAISLHRVSCSSHTNAGCVCFQVFE